jgi:hypothetical protein
MLASAKQKFPKNWNISSTAMFLPIYHLNDLKSQMVIIRDSSPALHLIDALS